MTQTQIDVDGIDVFIEGEGTETLVMIHGWPDSYHLWDNTVEALKANYRCVRFTLPGYDLSKPPASPSLEQMTATILRVIDATNPVQKITVLVHDWGCIFGYEFVAQHTARVTRMVAVDIGDYNTPAFATELSTSAKFAIFAYQFWLATAWKLGNFGLTTIANAMTQFMARKMRCVNPPEKISWQQNYPYAMRWFGLQGGLSHTLPVAPTVPLLYIYGAHKPFMFHSEKWLQALPLQPGSEVRAFDTGHWVMVQAPQQFNACITKWLAGSTYK